VAIIEVDTVRTST